MTDDQFNAMFNAQATWDATMGYNAVQALQKHGDKDTIMVDELIPRLKAFYVQNPDGKILINGDENARFNDAIYVFDEARKTGFKKVYIETRTSSFLKPVVAAIEPGWTAMMG